MFDSFKLFFSNQTSTITFILALATFIIAIVLVAKSKKTEHFVTAEEIAEDPSAMGLELGALEKWHQSGYVSRSCYNKAHTNAMTGEGFADLVSCLQGDIMRPAINNLNV